MKKIYLAGPDVFLENAKEHGAKLKQICKEYGFIGLFPLDNEITGNSISEIATKIRDANIKMINECDIVIANVSAFRGPEPDSGTIWEIGYAQALGKRVIAYCDDSRSLKQRTIEMLNLNKDDTKDMDNNLIEDFGLTHNLMFAHLVVAKSFIEALEILRD